MPSPGTGALVERCYESDHLINNSKFYTLMDECGYIHDSIVKVWCRNRLGALWGKGLILRGSIIEGLL